ncbi:sensor histidine kinase [Reinekea marinisedimentorum]|uniref:histidine kinase n=1 Tax=Reinekea marinisedimentorum TaxID=230495 RepID=A0A4R3I870_9GAMM|nr:HAMP domain-containing sensor histidine kinase [Reinekea marinisedimentorum]TCS41151.1 two-component system sensor histidine kinase GlrK [Reinekea marinisedimentorum]
MNLPLRHISLRNLVLIGFLISLVPLGVFFWQSQKAQERLTSSWQQLTDNSIHLVRMAVELDSLVVEIERSTKQFFILQTPDISTLAKNNIDQYEQVISEFCSFSEFGVDENCDTLSLSVAELAGNYASISQNQLNTLLTDIKKNQQNLLAQMWASIELAKARQVEFVRIKREQIAVALAGVSFLTFVLLTILTGQVAGPVNTLKDKISRLGKSERPVYFLQEQAVFAGPKELQEINTKLDRLAMRLAKFEELRQSFLRHASHELKTPLSGIIEGCSILRDKISGPLTDTQAEVVNILENCSRRLTHLTEQLLDYNYLLRHSKPEIKSVDGCTLLHKTIEGHRQLFSRRGQTIATDCNIKSLNTDVKLFTRILDNLLSNAQVYGHQNGKVLVRLIADETDRIVMTVCNTGPGVPEDQKNSLLEPFARSEVPRNDSLPGTGLGLSIVRDCVLLLAGEMKFVDVAGFDFSIMVLLPRHYKKEWV